MTAPPALPDPPRLRRGCRLTLQEFENGASWILENTSTGKFFRMGLREERFIRKLDGTNSLKQIFETLSKDGTSEDLSPTEALQLLQRLMAMDLLDGNPDAGRPGKKPLFNPMFMRVPLGNPDRIFGWMARKLGRLPIRPCLAIAVTLLIVGAYAVASDIDRFTITMGSVFSVGNIPAFFLSFLLLKLIHETAHGVTCKALGGRVPDAGLYFVFFVPLTYIDATSAWSFPSRRARILVSSAGMLTELLVAAMAGLVWVNTPLGAINTVASNVVISASITTLLFNANPLMRFDGYFILSDAMRIPNLYALASKAASSALAWFFLGVPQQQPRPLWITLYGIGCLIWRISLVVGISIGAIALLHGIGIILAALTLSGVILPATRNGIRYAQALHTQGFRVSLWRWAAWGGLVLFISFVPLNPPPASPAVIEPADMISIRVQCPGFVQKVEVTTGQSIDEGEILVSLSNPEEVVRHGKLQAEAKRMESMANHYRQAAEHKLMVQHLEQAAGLQKQAQEARQYLNTLQITAPRRGTVFGRNLDELTGTFLQTGKEILIVGSTDRQEARIAIGQELVDRIRPAIGQKVEILIPGRSQKVRAEVVSVEASGTRDIRFESLTALAGGPLAVITRQAAEGASRQKGMELIEPQFYVSALIDDSVRLHPGEIGWTRFPDAYRRTLLQSGLAQIRAFIQRSIDRVSPRTH